MVRTFCSDCFHICGLTFHHRCGKIWKSDIKDGDCMKKKKLMIAAVTAAAVILLNAWGFAMKTEHYTLSSEKLSGGLRIVFVSDLHNCFYGGTDQSGIIEKIDSEHPDIVIFGGDVIDFKGGTKYALRLMRDMKSKYRCFYSPGNHEELFDDEQGFYKKVEALEINVLTGGWETAEVDGQSVRIYGAQNAYSDEFDSCVRDAAAHTDTYNILVVHQPEQVKGMLEGGSSPFDLVLSGHAHAGQWRIPKLLDQGLYAPDQGLFPKYTNGMYSYGSSSHLISRGLARPLRMIFIPRIFNRPELSVIEIKGEE